MPITDRQVSDIWGLAVGLPFPDPQMGTGDPLPHFQPRGSEIDHNCFAHSCGDWAGDNQIYDIM